MRAVGLVGLWPLVFSRSVFGGAAKTWVHEFSCSGSPLLDRHQAIEVIDLMFQWLKHRNSHLHGLSAIQLPKAGPAYGLLYDQAKARDLNFSLLCQFDRAALNARIVGVGARDFVSPKKKKELQRQFRRLRELGSVTFGVSARRICITRPSGSLHGPGSQGMEGASERCFPE